MWKDVIEKEYILYFIAGLLLWGIISEFLVALRYRKLIKESENMGLTKLKLFKQMKLKFENSYRLHMGMNTSIFIDKYMFKNKFLGINLFSWNRMPLEIFMLASVLSVSAMIVGYYANLKAELLLKYPVICIVGGILLCMVWQAVDVDCKMDIVKTNIMDYLENSLAFRVTSECALTQTLVKPSDIEHGATVSDGQNRNILPREEDSMKKEIREDIKSMKQQISYIEKEKDNKILNNQQDEEIIEDIIKQFLT